MEIDLENISNAAREIAVTIDNLRQGEKILRELFSNDDIKDIKISFVVRGGSAEESYKSHCFIIAGGRASGKTIRIIQDLITSEKIGNICIEQPCGNATDLLDVIIDELNIKKIINEEFEKDYKDSSLEEIKYMQPRNLTCRDYMRKIKGKSLKRRIFIHQNR